MEMLITWLSRHPFLRFLLVEVIATTTGLILVSTFLTYSALSLMPREERDRGARTGVFLQREQSDLEEAVDRDTLTLWAKEGDFKFLVPLFARYIAHDFEGLGGTAGSTNGENSRIGYFRWLTAVATGNLGATAQAGDVWDDELRNQLPVTVPLCVGAYLLSAILGILLALVHAARDENLFASTVFYAVLLVSSLPAFLLGYVILGASLTTLNPSLLFPILVLVFSGGVLTEMSLAVSHAMDREMSQDYINTAKVKGLNPRTILPLPGTVAFHAFREAATHFLPQVARRAPQVVGMGLVVEIVFGLKGLSIMLIDGLESRQDHRVLTVVMIAVLLVQSCSWVTTLLQVGFRQRVVRYE